MANTTSKKSRTGKRGDSRTPSRSANQNPARDRGVARPTTRVVGSETVSMIRFSAKLLRPAATAKGGPAGGDWTFLNLPKEASAKLPSRGQATVEGTFNGSAFQATLEPDGEGGHWLKVDRKMAGGAEVGDI